MKILSNYHNLQVLFEDNHLIIINKRTGDIIQGDKTKDTPLVEIVKEYLKIKYDKPGNVYLGVIHRIDRPTSGIVMFAKTSKALSRMNAMLKNQDVNKLYWAITQNKPDNKTGKLIHWLRKNPKNNKSTHFSKETANAKRAVLNYRILKTLDNYYLLEIKMESGRHHQIRCQLQAIGCPIKGDIKYGSKRTNKDGSIDLHARNLQLIHPVTKKEIDVTAPVRDEKIWKSCI
ncbi:MAG: RNA pseudouridine synthase [Pelagibacterales bacterium]|nr:RNA pseudouridine synthase [Pelagibacterales bacterium]